MRKILLIAPQPFYVNRGTPINVRALAEWLAELRYDVHLLTLPHGNSIDMPGVTIHRCPRLPFVHDLPVGISWRKVLYDILLLGHASWLSLTNRFAFLHGIEDGAIIAGVAARLRNTPFVFDMDSCMPSQLRETKLGKTPLLPAIEYIERYFLKRAVAIVTVCEALTDRVRATLPLARIYQIEDFPLESAATYDDAAVAKVRADLNIDSASLIVYTGNLESYQGVDLLLEAFSRAIGQNTLPTQPVLLIVGGNVDQISHYREKAARLAIDRNVLFCGMRPVEEMGVYMAAADLLVSPRSVGSNTPLKIYTYMASGKPILATSIAAHTQVLNDDVAFLTSTDPSDFSRVLLNALDQSADGFARRERKAHAAKELVKERYSLQAFRNKVRRLYLELSGEVAIGETPEVVPGTWISAKPEVEKKNN